MKKIVIIGGSGFGREVKTLIDQINIDKPQYEILGFYDDNTSLPKAINNVPYLGKLDDLMKSKEKFSAAMGIGVPLLKEKVFEKIKKLDLDFPPLIHPSVIIGKDNIHIGQGCIICAGNILTCDMKVGDFVTLNLSCTVGHDTNLGNFSSFMPSVNISGDVQVMNNVYVGTGAKIINNLTIGSNSIIGAGAVVAKSIPADCTAVGIPAKPIKFNK